MKDKSNSRKRLVVIGGGAAGFFCAVNAARLAPALEVVLVEKSNKLLAKVKVSGGGRCNITHACFDVEEMSTNYPRGKNFVKKTFHRFFTPDTINWFESRGVKLKTEADGRMFPATDSSQTVIDCLLNEAGRYEVKINPNTEVRAVKYEGGKFSVELFDSRTGNCRFLASDFILVACGGYPKLSMFRWIQAMGHKIEEPVPSLFTFNLPHHPITRLMGISTTRSKVKIKNTKFEQEGPLLITHWGLSGPVVLRLSAWAARHLAAENWNFQISVNWLAQYNEQNLRQEFQQLRYSLAAQKMAGKNPFQLPGRLWQFLAVQSGVKEEWRWADLPSAEQNRFIKNIINSEFLVKGKTMFKEEFVTAGGICIQEVDHNTMMSKKIPGLFFAGEVLDVDAITGGFNFQHAWTSGFIAAESIASLAEKQ